MLILYTDEPHGVVSIVDSLQPSKEMYISTVAKDPSVSGDSDKTRVPLGKVYRMNCRQSKQTSMHFKFQEKEINL